MTLPIFGTANEPESTTNVLAIVQSFLDYKIKEVEFVVVSDKVSQLIKLIKGQIK